MANCLPFNAVYDGENYDRAYKAEDWAWYFATFIANGIFPKPSDGLQVIAYSGMEIKVNAGFAFINGYAFKNPASHSIRLDMAEGALNRVDRVVVRWDLPQRDIYIAVLKGTPSAKPQPTAVTRSTEIWELALADIYVGKGVTKIQTKDITDQRFNSSVCGIVTGTVEEIDASVLTKQFDEGMVYLGGGTWVDIYLNSDDGAEGLKSEYNCAPMTGTEGMNWYRFTERLMKSGKRMPDYSEFCAYAFGSPQGLAENNTNAWSASSNTQRGVTGSVVNAVSAVGCVDAVDQSENVKKQRAGYGDGYYRKYAGGAVAPAIKKLYRVRKSWKDAASQLGAFEELENAKNACKEGYTVYDWDGKAVYSKQTTKKLPYKVQIDVDDLRIRTGAGIGYAVTGEYTGRGVFTIVEEKAGKGSTAGWGKLKSGAGWVSLDYCTKLV